jgi:hypothetical protein
MNFEKLLLRAKKNDARSLEELTSIYKYLLIKESTIDGVFDKNLYQELWLVFINCIHKFNI